MEKSEKQTAVFKEDFKDLKNWTAKGTIMLGKWIAENGVLTYINTSDAGENRASLRTKSKFFGISSLTADILLPNNNSTMGFIIRHTYNESVLVTVFSENGKVRVSFGKTDRVKFVNKSGKELAQADITEIFRLFEWNRFELNIDKAHFTLDINGKQVAGFVIDGYTAEAGEFMVKTTCNYASFRNLTVEAEYTEDPPADFEEIPDGEPTKYIMDFREDKKPYGFTEAPATELWNITERDGKKVYGTGNRDGFTHTWLHAFEKDGETAATVAVFDPKYNANFGIFSRFAVEGSYLKAGYDFFNNRWFIRAKSGYCFEEQSFYSDKSVLYTAKYYELKLKYYQGNATLFVNGEPRVTATELHNKMYGRTGLFAENTDLYAEKFSADFDHGVKVTDGVIEQTVCPDKLQSHLEIERVDENTLFGVYGETAYLSNDLGIHFEADPEGYDWDKAGDNYPSILKMSGGGYIKAVSARDFEIMYSDDLKKWKSIGHMFPKGRTYDEAGHQLGIVHVSSMTEIEMPDGTKRIFCPVAFRVYKGNAINGHNTAVFYSDDRGKTWTESENDSMHIDGLEWFGSMSWCESKVIKCSDGTLRMYCTRNIEPYMHYVESADGGKTWGNFGVKKDMPCPLSSYAICEDPLKSGRYFMTYVKDKGYNRNETMPRRRLVLCVTENGKDFFEVMDIERFSIPESGPAGELYQILDPCVTVCEDYIFIGYGRSDQLGGKASTFHNGQRIRFTRIDRKKANI